MTTPTTTTTTPTTILKRERFYEDNLQALLVDSDFSSADRKHLSAYNKHRTSGGRVNVSYKFGKGCEDHQLGRLFPDDGLGLQSFRFDIRNPLAQKFYWDTDVENCHYVIALKYCIEYKVDHKTLLYYIENRDKSLRLVSADRKKAKTEFLKVLYGGDITLYNPYYKELEGDVTPEGFELLKELEKEMTALMVMIWERHPQYHKLRTGKDRKLMCNKSNHKASLMSLIFQTEERKILLAWDDYLASKDRYLGVYIHDGGYVEKLDGEAKFPVELLEDGSRVINERLGYTNLKFTQKDIAFDWTPKGANRPLTLGIDGVGDDAGACDVILELYPHWKTCNETLYVFDNTTGLWRDKISIIYDKILDCEDRLWILKKNRDGKLCRSEDNYARLEKFRRNIIPFIKSKTVDDNWLREKEHSSMGKLLFPNGVLDLRNHKFYPKDEYPFNPDIVFSYRMPQDFIYDDIDHEYMDSIKQRLFYDPLGKEVGDYLILQFARALAGDLVKRLTFCIGTGDNGKSVIGDAIKNACGDYFGTFDAQDVEHNPNSSRDGGQRMRPFYLSRNKRILMSQELGSGCVMSGDVIKKISSGGDTLTGRLHGGNETPFIPQCGIFSGANEFPRFYKIDSTTYDRMRVINFPKKFVINPTDENELLRDDNIKTEINEVRFRGHFIAILVDSYFQFLDDEKVEIVPLEVIAARNDWVGDCGEFNIMGKFLESYELTNNAEDFVTSGEVKYWLDANFKGTSMEKFSMLLKTYCIKTFKEDCKIVNKNKKISGKVLKCWFGIKIIPDEEEVSP